jgi:hypothetical protein
MTEAPVLPLHQKPARQGPDRRVAQPRAPGVPSTERSMPILVSSPDRYCAELLLEEAVKVFPAEIVTDSGWSVRLHPPGGADSVIAVLSLVEAWMASIPLPSTKVFCGDAAYVAGASADVGRPLSTLALPATPVEALV